MLQCAVQEQLLGEEIMWKNKSRVTWLTMPDLNTRYFHLTTLIRRRRNVIEYLKTPNSTWLDSQQNVGDHVCNYFQKLFSSSQPTLSQDLEDLIPSVITREDNQMLVKF